MTQTRRKPIHRPYHRAEHPIPSSLFTNHDLIDYNAPMTFKNRQAALHLLQDVLKKRLPLDQLANDHLSKLTPQDQKFSKALTLTTLRHLGDIDWLIEQNMHKPWKKNKLENLVLRLGVAQLIFMDGVAEHAAISTTVDLAKKTVFHSAKVINGVLRSIQKMDFDGFIPGHTSNVPKWLRLKIDEDYGHDKAEPILRAMLESAKLNLRWRTATPPPEFLEHVTPLFSLSHSFVLENEDISPTNLPGWADGHVIVQEAAAQIPAQLAKNLSVEGAVLDACAAPGGKSVQLFDILPDRPIIAADVNPDRLKKVKENIERCKVGVAIQKNDATEPTFEQESLAAILLDVPCSATGTTRRHPDVFHTRTAESVDELVKLQKKILDASAPCIKKGGLIIYSTCSLLKCESEEQIEAFLKRHDNFERVYIDAAELGLPDACINKNGEFRSTPDMGLDGFFAAVLKRTA